MLRRSKQSKSLKRLLLRLRKHMLKPSLTIRPTVIKRLMKPKKLKQLSPIKKLSR